MDNVIQRKLKIFGYDEFFESNRKKLMLDDFSVARITAEHKGAYNIINENGEFSAKITGKQMFGASSREDYPAVGDWVAITELDSQRAVIHSILPRKTIIKRKYGDKNRTGNKIEIQVIGANIDVAFIVESVDRDYNLNRLERYFVLAKDGGIQPAILLNKIDTIAKTELDQRIDEIKKRFNDIDVIATSAIKDQELDKLEKYLLPGKTYCFLGSSGVGKSSLINRLMGNLSASEAIKTSDISSYSNRGKHTTTKRQMYFLKNGSIVIDNPGMREVGMANADKGVTTLFGEITFLAKKCKYADCAHTHEPGCAVINAVKSGKLDKGRYANYINLKKETEYYGMTEFEKREKDRQFGKFVKKAKKDFKNFRYKN